MDKTLAELSPREFERLIEQTIDRRMSVWLIQLLDTLPESRENEEAEMQPAFISSFREALSQAQVGEGIDLMTFRDQLGRWAPLKSY